MKINTNVWKIVLRFGLRRVSLGPVSKPGYECICNVKRLIILLSFAKHFEMLIKNLIIIVKEIYS